jgi:hypothetical protein
MKATTKRAKPLPPAEGEEPERNETRDRVVSEVEPRSFTLRRLSIRSRVRAGLPLEGDGTPP